MPGCCWQVECSTSPQRTHELLVRRDVLQREKEKRRWWCVCLDWLEGAEGTVPWRGLYGKGGRPPRFGRVRRVIFEYVHRHCASAVSRNEPFGFAPWPCSPLPLHASLLRSLDAKCSWFRARHARASPSSVWPPWRSQITNANHSFNYVSRSATELPLVVFRGQKDKSRLTDWLVRLQTLMIVPYDIQFPWCNCQ